ncbi:hypothetical protein [Paludibacterium sp.]|uniref:hypothetical protein n=1 Tax=Paludibacterium sp. TaxID=1917523 RepID=UPI0025F1AD8E|nr:hypothetical protein [Paludibacterium sp.]MBV8649697.1 hypothetical protein [Paludibacterium sp.]
METVKKTKRKPTGAAAMGAGPGRPKGVPNKTTMALKEMILGALDKKGGMDYLVDQADKNPVAFMSLVGKVLPMTIQGTGDDGTITVEIRRFGPGNSA